MLDSLAHSIIHVLIVLLLPPLLLGVINKVKAAFSGRCGPPLLQAYFDLGKLFRKGTVLSTTSTWVFRAGPVVGLATTLLAALLLPLGTHPAPIAFAGDLILFAYLLGLSRFFTISAALDTGSPFEGMGGAREATFGCLAEPTLFFCLMVLVRGSGALSLTTMLGGTHPAGWSTAGASLVLVAVSLFIVLLAESSRIPFDDPNTHLELTMVHEVMVLDHSGPALAMILYGAALKLFLFASLILRIAVPISTQNAWTDWALFVAGLFVLAVVVGTVESIMARLRLVHIPRLLVAASVLSCFGVVLLLV